MCVYKPSKNCNTWWYEFRFEGQKIRENTKSHSKKVAQDAEKARRRELEEGYNGIKRRPRAKLFSVAADDWLTVRKTDLAASSLRIERDNLKHLRTRFERQLLIDISHEDIADYQQKRLNDGASPKTVNLEVGTLRAILKKERLWANLQPDVKMLTTREDIGRCLTPEEETAPLSECLKSRSRQLYVAVLIALNTAMRYSEIRLLRWKQVDFDRKQLTVGASKTDAGEGRVIGLNPRILSVLEMWAERFPEHKPEHFIFGTEKCGGGGQEDDFGFTSAPVVYKTDPTKAIGSWKEGWTEAKARAGRALSGNPDDEEAEPLICRFHDLRHTACTRMLEHGTPFAIVAAIMGWASSAIPRMVKRYGHIGNQAQQDAVNRLGAEPDAAYSDYYKNFTKSEEVETESVQ